MERREFIRKGMIGATGAALTTTGMSAKSYASILGSNERVNVAVIGIRGMGQYHIEGYSKLKNARVTALCDVDQHFFEPRIKKLFIDKGLEKPKTYTDLRVLYENKEVDAVSIVTPNHWHALAAIWAIQAGKHVSVEKPCCHNIYEGRKLVEAAEKYPVIVQDGAEQRSNPCAESMADFLHSGKLGEVYMAKGICYKRRNTIGRTPDEPIPPGVDYNLWLGPGPSARFRKTASTITGIGTGIMETVISATREFTRSILPGGDLMLRCLLGSALLAAISCLTMTSKHPIRNSPSLNFQTPRVGVTRKSSCNLRFAIGFQIPKE